MTSPKSLKYLTSEWNQNNIISSHMHLVCCCSLPVWRRSFLKKGTSVTYFCPALDPPLGGSCRRTTTLVRDHEYFIHTKFHQNPLRDSGKEVENVKFYRRTTDGRYALTKAHLNLWLRWAKICSWIFSPIVMSYPL